MRRKSERGCKIALPSGHTVGTQKERLRILERAVGLLDDKRTLGVAVRPAISVATTAQRGKRNCRNSLSADARNDLTHRQLQVRSSTEAWYSNTFCDDTASFSPLFDDLVSVADLGSTTTAASTTSNSSSGSTNNSNNSRSALHVAIYNANESLVRLLIRHGADIERHDGNGETSLHAAARMGFQSIVRVLLEFASSVEVKDRFGRTALFPGIQSGDEGVVKLLLDAPIDPNCPDALGNLPLHLAVEAGSEPIILLLLSHGADINA